MRLDPQYALEILSDTLDPRDVQEVWDEDHEAFLAMLEEMDVYSPEMLVEAFNQTFVSEDEDEEPAKLEPIALDLEPPPPPDAT